jgi:hypothetical protein
LGWTKEREKFSGFALSDESLIAIGHRLQQTACPRVGVSLS